MDKNYDLNSKQLNELLRTLSNRLGSNPEEIQHAVQSGNINNLLKGLNPNDAEKIKKAMENKNIAEKLLASPQAQNLLKKLMEEK